MASRLEQALLSASAVIPGSEHQMDTLREVLVGNLGTPAQRSTLIRIIQQTAPRRPLQPRLATKLGIMIPNRTNYA